MAKASRAAATAPRVPLAPSFDVETSLGLVNALGGVAKVAASTDVPTDQVARWTVSGHISPGLHLRLFAKALTLGLTVNPAVFGFNNRDAEAQALVRLMMGGAHD